MSQDQWPVDERMLRGEIPVWIPSGNRSDRHQMDPFLRWYCFIRHRMPLAALWREMRRKGNPFSKPARIVSAETEKACWELAYTIRESLGLPTESTKTLGECLHKLLTLAPDDDEPGEWYKLAQQVKEFWLSQAPKGSGG